MNSQTIAASGAGAASAGVPRYTLASDDPAVALLGTIDTDTSSMNADLGTLAGAVTGTEFQVDVITMPSTAVTNAGTFATQATLQAGTAEIGKLAAGTATVGEVTIGAATTAAGDLGKAIDAVAGGSDVGIAGLAIRDDSLTTLTPADGDYVPLRVGSTGALHVTGGGGGTEYTEDVATANPIVGTATLMERDDALSTITPIEGDWAGLRCSSEGALWVQEFNSDAILADTANMDTNLGTLAGAVTGTEMQVDLVSANVTNAGTFATQVDGDALTALQLIDDIVHVDDTATHATGTTKGALIMGAATPTDGSVGANDIGAIAMSTDRRMHVDAQIVGTDAALDVSAATVTVDLGANNDVTATLDAETTKVIGTVIPGAAATGGMSYDMLALGAADNDKVIKGSAGTIYYISIQSTDATPVYLKLFDAASITPGTTSADLQFMCPANATAALGAGLVLNFGAQGIEFATGIVALVATGVALDDNTAVSANEVVVTIGFE